MLWSDLSPDIFCTSEEKQQGNLRILTGRGGSVGECYYCYTSYRRNLDLWNPRFPSSNVTLQWSGIADMAQCRK